MTTTKMARLYQFTFWTQKGVGVSVYEGSGMYRYVKASTSTYHGRGTHTIAEVRRVNLLHDTGNGAAHDS